MSLVDSDTENAETLACSPMVSLQKAILFSCRGRTYPQMEHTTLRTVVVKAKWEGLDIYHVQTGSKQIVTNKDLQPLVAIQGNDKIMLKEWKQ